MYGGDDESIWAGDGVAHPFRDDTDVLSVSLDEMRYTVSQYIAFVNGNIDAQIMDWCEATAVALV